MGCGSSARTSGGPQPVLPAAQVHGPADPEKCLRAGCKFKKHSTQEHGYCCNLCRMKGEHGPLCEKCDLSKPSSSKSADRVSLKWEPSLLFGPKCMGFDIEGGVTATETMHIEPHKGELFASFGKWMSPEYQKAQKSGKWIVNPFISRLSSAGGKWVVDMCDQGSSKHTARITCLKSVTFSRDSRGNRLEPAVEQLTACYDLGKHGNVMMFRVDGHAKGSQHLWQETNYTGTRAEQEGGPARAVLVHRDSITGVDRIIALEGTGGVVSGMYDPKSDRPGRVVWDKKPEKMDLSSVGNGKATRLPFRPLSLLVVNGKVFMSSASWILQRVDGPEPVWKGIIDIQKLRATDGELMQQVGGIRGMTEVPNPAGGSSILFCWNPNSTSRSWILRADVAADGSVKQPVEETSVQAEAKKYLQTEHLSYTLAAYNNMPAAKLGPYICNLIGFEIVAHGPACSQLPLDEGQKTGGAKHGYWSGAGICCRVAAQDYFVMEVGGRGGTRRALTAVRCFAQSPFPEEEGTIYFGGYDCNNFPSEHTAWIYKCSSMTGKT